MHDPALRSLREVTGKVVGSVFYATLLKQMRSSPLRGEFGHGGYGEKVFEAQLDAELAARAGMAGQSDLTNSLVERLADQQLRMTHSDDSPVEPANPSGSTRNAQPAEDPT